MKTQPLYQALVEAGMTGEEPGRRDTTRDLCARLLHSQALVKTPVADLLREFIRAAAPSEGDPGSAPLRALVAVASTASAEYDDLAKLSLKDWAGDVRDTLEPWACHDDQCELQTLRDFASMLHRRLTGPHAELQRLDGFFRTYCEVERDCWLEEEEEAFLAEMEVLWASLGEFLDIPDLSLLLCLEFDELKCVIARRTTRPRGRTGRAALARHRVALRTKLARLAKRMEAVCALGAVVRSGCTGRPRPSDPPSRVAETIQTLKQVGRPERGEDLEIIPLKEAARLLSVSLRKAYKMHQAGELQGPAGKPYRAYKWSVVELLRTPRITSELASPAPATQPEQPPSPATQGQKQPRRQGRSPQGYQFFELP